MIDTKSMREDEDLKDLYAEKIEKKREEEAERFKGLSNKMKAKKERQKDKKNARRSQRHKFMKMA